jgi:hypothetical protein
VKTLFLLSIDTSFYLIVLIVCAHRINKDRGLPSDIRKQRKSQQITLTWLYCFTIVDKRMDTI